MQNRDGRMNTDQNHLHALTGLRFFAALAVFVHHTGDLNIGGIDFPLGGYAVSFFFVLSGFILTYVYAGKLTRESIGNFYLRRVARIWPLHLVTLLICIACIFKFRGVSQQPGLLATNFFLLQSWIPNYQYIFSFNTVAWSISVEAFFYLVFPLFILGGFKRFVGKWILVAAIGIVAMIGLRYLERHVELPASISLGSIPHTNPVMRLFEFVTGIGCGFVYRRWIAPINTRYATMRGVRRVMSNLAFTFGDLLAIALIVAFWPLAKYLKIMETIAVSETFGPIFANWFRFSGAVWVFAVTIPYFAISRGYVTRLLGNRLFAYLGEISFAFYMIHQIVLLYLLRIHWDIPRLPGHALAASCFLLSLGFSVLLFHFVEKPARTAIVDGWKRRYGKATKTIRDAVVSVPRSPVVVAAMVLIAVNVTYLSVRTFDSGDERYLDLVRLRTPGKFQDHYFNDATTLLGVNFGRHGNVTVVDLAWRVDWKNAGVRIVQALDSQGNILRKTRQPFRRIVSGAGQTTVVDRIVFTPRQLRNVTTLELQVQSRRHDSTRLSNDKPSSLAALKILELHGSTHIAQRAIRYY